MRFSRSLPSQRMQDSRGILFPWRIRLSCEGRERRELDPLPAADEEGDGGGRHHHRRLLLYLLLRHTTARGRFLGSLPLQRMPEFFFPRRFGFRAKAAYMGS